MSISAIRRQWGMLSPFVSPMSNCAKVHSSCAAIIIRVLVSGSSGPVSHLVQTLLESSTMSCPPPLEHIRQEQDRGPQDQDRGPDDHSEHPEAEHDHDEYRAHELIQLTHSNLRSTARP